MFCMFGSSIVRQSPERFGSNRWAIVPECVLLIVLVCSSGVGQTFVQRHYDVSKDHGAFGSGQLVTPNALKAPTKAQQAAQRALQALFNNRPREAEKQLNRALNIYPDYAMALTFRALLEWTNYPDDSVRDLQRAIHLDPAYGLAYATLGAIYNTLGRYGDAEPLIQRALQSLSAAWPIHYEMARSLLGRHKSNEALAQVNQAIEQASIDEKSRRPHNLATLHYLRGLIFIELHELAGAKLEFQAAGTEEPEGTLAQRSKQMVSQLDSQATQS